jgi:hypothetical protein
MPAISRLDFSHQCNANNALVASITSPNGTHLDMLSGRSPGTSSLESILTPGSPHASYAVSVGPQNRESPIPQSCFFQLDSNVTLPIPAVVSSYVAALRDFQAQLVDIKVALTESAELPLSFASLLAMPTRLDEQLLFIDERIADLESERDALKRAQLSRSLTSIEVSRLASITANGGHLDLERDDRRRLESLRTSVSTALQFASACSPTEGDAQCIDAVAEVSRDLDDKIAAGEEKMRTVTDWLMSETERLQAISSELSAQMLTIAQAISQPD